MDLYHLVVLWLHHFLEHRHYLVLLNLLVPLNLLEHHHRLVLLCYLLDPVLLVDLLHLEDPYRLEGLHHLVVLWLHHFLEHQ